MDSLLVLGLIPGTNIQITFIAWLLLGVATIAAFALLYIKRRHLLMFWMLARDLNRQLSKLDHTQLTLKLS